MGTLQRAIVKETANLSVVVFFIDRNARNRN